MGKTIAHGKSYPSRDPYLQPGRPQDRPERHKLRLEQSAFHQPVQVGARIRGRQKMLAVDDMPAAAVSTLRAAAADARSGVTLSGGRRTWRW
jgi:hypothetical protein